MMTNNEISKFRTLIQHWIDELTSYFWKRLADRFGRFRGDVPYDIATILQTLFSLVTMFYINPNLPGLFCELKFLGGGGHYGPP